MKQLIEIDARDAMQMDRHQNRAAQYSKGGWQNAIYNSVEDHALDGYAVRYTSPFIYEGRVVYIEPNAFRNTIDTKCRVAFNVEHNARTEVGTTDDCLTLIDDDDGLKFRLHLGRARMGPMIARMVDVNNRAATSIGCDILKEREEEINGTTVRVIERARLKEVTLCRIGASGDAFASLVDTTITPMPKAGSRSARFEADYAVHKIARKLQALKASISSLPTEPPISFTLADSRRWQSEETDRLQNMARAMHCR